MAAVGCGGADRGGRAGLGSGLRAVVVAAGGERARATSVEQKHGAFMDVGGTLDGNHNWAGRDGVTGVRELSQQGCQALMHPSL